MMDGFAYVTSSFVRFRDADPMQMANHAVIVSYLETARTEYMMELLDIERVDEINYVMARVECDYRSPARYGERLRTGVRIEELGETSATLGYRVEETDSGRLIAEAKTVQVFYDYDRQAPMPVPDAVREAVDFETGAQR